MGILLQARNWEDPLTSTPSGITRDPVEADLDLPTFPGSIEEDVTDGQCPVAQPPGRALSLPDSDRKRERKVRPTPIPNQTL